MNFLNGYREMESISLMSELATHLCIQHSALDSKETLDIGNWHTKPIWHLKHVLFGCYCVVLSWSTKSVPNCIDILRANEYTQMEIKHKCANIVNVFETISNVDLWIYLLQIMFVILNLISHNVECTLYKLINISQHFFFHFFFLNSLLLSIRFASGFWFNADFSLLIFITQWMRDIIIANEFVSVQWIGACVTLQGHIYMREKKKSSAVTK